MDVPPFLLTVFNTLRHVDLLAGWTSPSLSLSTALALSESRFAQRFPGYQEWRTVLEQHAGRELAQHQQPRQLQMQER